MGERVNGTGGVKRWEGLGRLESDQVTSGRVHVDLGLIMINVKGAVRASCCFTAGTWRCVICVAVLLFVFVVCCNLSTSW